MGKYLLGLDNGNTVCKAVLFDVHGTEIQVASRKMTMYHPQPGYCERNMDELWQVTADTVKEVITRAGINARDIISIGSSGHGNGLYLIDKSGRSLLGVSSLDTRAGQICDEWNQNRLSDSVYPYTFQEFWAAQTNALLAWVKRFAAPIYENIGYVLLCKDFINYRLTGEIASDFSDFSTTNLLDVRHRTYNDSLLELYDLDDIRSSFPRLVNSCEVIGKVSKLAAEQTGLAVGTPVVGGMLDVDASMIGSGVAEVGQTCIISGTWGINSLVTEKPLANPAIAMSAIFSVPNRWVSIEASATSMSNLEWFVNQFCQPEHMEANRRGVSVYSICDEIVADLPLENSGIIFHPFLYGSNTQANARAGFYGLAGWHTRADVLRSLYEGIVFGHLTHIRKLEKGGAIFKNVRLTGGGARSSVLGQIFADTLNAVIEVPSHTETGTWGVALTAGIGAGTYADYREAIQATVEIGKVYEPNTPRVEIYNARYQIFQQLITELHESWNKLPEL